MKAFLVTLAALLLAGIGAAAPAAEPLKLAAKYDMPAEVKGRFDHLAVDLRGQRLFLTAESAHEVLVFDLGTGKFIRAIPDIGIPHAVFCREDLNRIYITDGGAGELKVYDGKTYQLLSTAKLKVDADSIGYDPATHELYIDNGGGDAHEPFSMLSVVDTTSGQKVADIKIDGETLEAMALSHSGPRLYVNNPAKNEVDVVNRKTRAVLASWPVTMGKRNVAMALDEPAHRLFVACRSGELVVIDTGTGKELQALPIAKGVDDLIFDPARKRLYAACAAGELDVYGEKDPDHYVSLGQIPAAPGAKNEVLVESLQRLFTTVPPQGGAAGQVYVYEVH
ncbi:MAG TPA: YncE family protein [Terriglobia bacterium]|nr:YncE family protein [Terriglobia bacterium]